jgi:rhodanese-related sulfurtransferase
MDWLLILIVGGAIAAGFVLKRLTLVSAAQARQYLQQGALVVDVRGVAEYRARHVAGAVNIPLGELAQRLPGRVADKGQVLLLHCLSGTRSGIAKRMLTGMGYTRVFNLGSYGRAQRIVGGK